MLGNYDPQLVLAAIDQNKWPILALCSCAMICNYTWFFAAVRQGFKDQTVPIPIFCTLFWLAGDASMVLRYDLWFHVINHWYVKLFWLALVFTVATELVFLYMTLRFGQKEYAPNLSQRQFSVLTLAGLLFVAATWSLLKQLIDDPLYIDYFHLANFVGPSFGMAMVMRRGTRAGTTPFIWAAYALMLIFWFTACALWYGAPFAEPRYLVLYGLTVAAAVLLAVMVSRMPAPGAQPRS